MILHNLEFEAFMAYLKRQEISVSSVEDVVIEEKGYFAFHPVRFTQLAYFIEVFGLPLWACGWLLAHVLRG